MNNLSFEQNLTPEQKIQICEHLATVVMGYLSTTMGNPNHCAIWWYSHSGETIPKSRWNPLENANQISLCLKHFHYYQHFKTPETVSFKISKTIKHMPAIAVAGSYEIAACVAMCRATGLKIDL